MIKVTIKKFLSLLLEKNFCNIELDSAVIGNSDVLKIILDRNKFKQEWHKRLDYSFQNEHYKIDNINIIKKKDSLKALVTVTHSFTLNNLPSKIISVEKLNCIFIFKKINRKYKIIDYCFKEEFPLNYNNLLNNYESDNNLRQNDEFNLNLSKISFWKNKLINIDNLEKYIKSVQIKYRISYEDDSVLSSSNLASEYNPFETIKYARKFALAYNKDYRSFKDMGGDCTNYVSQCLHFGGINLTNLWKPYTNSWIRVNELYNFITKKGYGKQISLNQLFTVGSVIQFLSNKKGFYSHSGLITKVLANGDYLYCCHSYDKLDFPLSEIYPLFYDNFRVIEINKRG